MSIDMQRDNHARQSRVVETAKTKEERISLDPVVVVVVIIFTSGNSFVAKYKAFSKCQPSQNEGANDARREATDVKQTRLSYRW